MSHYSFKQGWTVSLGSLILIVLFVTLGNWQLHRADEKTTLMENRKQKTQEPPLHLTGNEPLTEAHRFRRVELDGLYDSDHQFLLDNQVYRQQAGYHALTPLGLDGSPSHILINRGWLPLGSNRDAVPDLTLHTRQVHITGIVDHFPAVGLKLKGGEIPTADWPAKVQRLEVEPLTARLGYPLLSYQVLLDESVPDGYLRDWKQPDLQPEKNKAYAFQWFLFAVLTAAVYLWRGFRPVRKTGINAPPNPSES